MCLLYAICTDGQIASSNVFWCRGSVIIAGGMTIKDANLLLLRLYLTRLGVLLHNSQLNFLLNALAKMTPADLKVQLQFSGPSFLGGILCKAVPAQTTTADLTRVSELLPTRE
jgi:hypothetical protein